MENRCYIDHQIGFGRCRVCLLNTISWNEIHAFKDKFASCCIFPQKFYFQNDKLLHVETNDMKVSSAKTFGIINLFLASFLSEHNVERHILLSYNRLSIINCIYIFKRQIIKLSRNYAASVLTVDVGKMIYHLVKQIYHYAQDRKFNG